MKYSAHIIHLDWLKVKVIGELIYVMIREASNHMVHQVIGIVVDIHKAYGLITQ